MSPNYSNTYNSNFPRFPGTAGANSRNKTAWWRQTPNQWSYRAYYRQQMCASQTAYYQYPRLYNGGYMPVKQQKLGINDDFAAEVSLPQLVKLYYQAQRTAMVQENWNGQFMEPVTMKRVHIVCIKYGRPKMDEETSVLVPLRRGHYTYQKDLSGWVGLQQLKKDGLNMRCCSINLLPFVQKTEFPYAIILRHMGGSGVRAIVHNDLSQIINAQPEPAIYGYNYHQVLEPADSFVGRYLEISALFVGKDVSIGNKTDIQHAACSQFCISGQDKHELQALVDFCNRMLGYVPALYHSPNLSTFSFPDEVYDQERGAFVPLSNFDRQLLSPVKKGQDQIKIMTWNIKNTHTLFYEDQINVKNPFHLWLANKTKSIERWVMDEAPDVLCLQEAGVSEYIDFGAMGYEYISTALSDTRPDIEAKDRADTTVCTAVCVRSGKFKVLEHRSVYFSRLASDENLARGFGYKPNEEVTSKFPGWLMQHSTATIVKLNHSISGRELVVVSVYPSFRIDLDPRKYLALKYLEQEVASMRCNNVILCGDFNMTPNACNYFMLRGAKFSPEWVDQNIMSIQDYRLKVKYNEIFNEELRFNYFPTLKLKSCYGEHMADGVRTRVVEINGKKYRSKEPEYTCISSKGTFCDCLDYIMYSSSIDLYCLGCGAFYTREYYSSNAIPSDHAPLIGLFELAKSTVER